MSKTKLRANAASASDPLLRISDLTVEFSQSRSRHPQSFTAVKKVSLTVRPGQWVALVGESGSGKSTTAMSVLGLLPDSGHITSGSISFQGKEISGYSNKDFEKIRGQSIGLVPQDPMTNLNPVWTVKTQVAEALRANAVKLNASGRQTLLDRLDPRKRVEAAKETDDRVIALLQEAGLKDAAERAGQYPHQFSGGMRQRVLIAMALAQRPALLIADEPTSALDVTVQKKILDNLQSLTRSLGTSVLFITHDLGLAAQRADQIAVMHQGEIVEFGPGPDVVHHPQHPYTQKLIHAAPSLSSQRIRSGKPQRPPNERDIPLLQVRGLSKKFPLPGSAGSFQAVDSVSFDLYPGRTIAIVGESGSGKSTLARMILHLTKPISGQVLFMGQPTDKLTRAQLLDFRRQVQPVFQNPFASLDPMYSIYRVLEEPLRIHHYGNRRQRHQRITQLLDLVALPQETMNKYPHELSGGQRQRVAIARALALDPTVVVADEAVSALDVLVQDQILHLLADVQEERGLAYIFITHDLAVVRQIADELIVMQAGRVQEKGATEDIFSHPQTRYTQDLLDAIPGRSLIQSDSH